MGKIKHISDASIHAALHLAAREPGKEFELYDNYGNSCTLKRVKFCNHEFGHGDYIKITGDSYGSSVIIDGTRDPQDTIGALYYECLLAISNDKQHLSRFNTQTGKTEYFSAGYGDMQVTLNTHPNSDNYGACVATVSPTCRVIWTDTKQTLVDYLDEHGLL